ncbi:mechanosensitive ion channel family protein [Azotosporobacter soli]|uniref:mechanosensitive ion channel family protein n=1 Tax=Azotosporobacter soli TaxID=3055040 RepID=UPI0031FE5F6A
MNAKRQYGMILVICLFGLLLWGARIAAAAGVMFEGMELYSIDYGIGSFSAEDRAAVVATRIQVLADNSQLGLEVEESPYPGGIDVIVGKQVLFSITDEEAAAAGKLRSELTAQRWQIIKQAVISYREMRSEKSVWIRSGIGIIGTLLLYGSFRGMRFIRPRIERKLITLQKNVTLLPKDLSGFLQRQIIGSAVVLLQPIYLLLRGSFAVVYLITLLRLFPASVPYAESLLSYTLQPVHNMVIGIVEYLPNLVIVLLIILLSRYLLKGVRHVASQIETKEIVVGGFDAEWGMPTYNIVRFLMLALTLIAVFPYLPGSQSPVFQGISVFLGLLISLGSSSMVNNIFSGFVLIYTSAYRVGDYIMVGTHFGKVLERSILVTRLLTPKNETVTLPNATMLGSNIINYSVQASGGGLILHTEVTIGYDVSWRKVHALLLTAAANTDGILQEPLPFVLQTGLEDFYAKYELNVFTRQADQIPLLYSRLHQAIQDAFHKEGVEIMSPHYAAWRNGETAAIPLSDAKQWEEFKCKE